MVRQYRFLVPESDYRPVVWPIDHPYWCTGERGDGASVLVAYADSQEQLKRWWPDAIEVDDWGEVNAYEYSGRRPKPKWFTNPLKFPEVQR